MAPKSNKKDGSKCIKCNLLLHKVAGTKKIIKIEEEAKLFTENIKKTIIVGDVLCKKCFLKYNSYNNNKKDEGESIPDDSSKENNETNSSMNDSFDWQDSSSPNENTDDSDFELSTDELVSEMDGDSDEDQTKAKRRKTYKFNLSVNNLDSHKNVTGLEISCCQSSLQNTLADQGSESDEITKSDKSFGHSSLDNNLSLD